MILFDQVLFKKKYFWYFFFFLQTQILNDVFWFRTNFELWDVSWKSISPVWLLAIPRTVVHLAPVSMVFSRQEHWSGCLSCLLLSRVSRVWLCATPQTAAHQAPPSLGFSRQEHWSGLPFPSPVHESEKSKWSRLFPTLSNPMDWSLPGSSVHGICQARVLEWGAIA